MRVPAAGEPSGQGEEPPGGSGWLSALPDRSAPPAGGCGPSLDGQPGAVDGEAPEVVQPDAVLEGVWHSRSGVAAMVKPPFEQLPVPVGDEAFCIWQEGQLGTIRFTRRTMSRTGAGVRLGLEGGAVVSATSAAPHPVRNRPPGIWIASMRLCRLLCWRMVMEKRTSRQTDTTPSVPRCGP